MDSALLPPFLILFLKFALVGAIGFFIDFGLTYLCKEVFHLNKYKANAIGFFVAATCNFLLNRMWTFSNSDPNIWVQYAVFISLGLIGLLISSSVIWFLHSRKKKNFYVSKVIATLIVIVWNFSSNVLLTFR